MIYQGAATAVSALSVRMQTIKQSNDGNFGRDKKRRRKEKREGKGKERNRRAHQTPPSPLLIAQRSFEENRNERAKIRMKTAVKVTSARALL